MEWHSIGELQPPDEAPLFPRSTVREAHHGFRLPGGLRGMDLEQLCAQRTSYSVVTLMVGRECCFCRPGPSHV